MVLKPPPRPRRLDVRWFWLKTLAHALALLPLLLMLQAIWLDRLGADPIAELTHRTGDWALRLLLLTLGMTPLRRWTGQPWPLRFRRLLGLYSFFYACLHLAVYVVLDLNGYWAQILTDIVKRPFITVGFLAWLLLLTLALTSTQAAMRRLGRRWGQLHKAVYACALLAVLHFFWLVKANLNEPALYAGVLAILLAARLTWAWRQSRLRPLVSANKPAAR